MTTPQDLKQAVISGDVETVKSLTKAAIGRGDKAADVMEQMISAMDIVGERMGASEMFIPEVLMSAKAMSAGTDLLKPLLSENESSHKGTIVIGSVRGDLHDIGKNLIEVMFEGAGFTVVDLGVDVPAENFVSAVRDNNSEVIGMSALLTTTMPAMKEVIDSLSAAGLRNQVKIMVGGAPVTKEYAEKIGADAYGADAGSAVKIARSLLQDS